MATPAARATVAAEAAAAVSATMASRPSRAEQNAAIAAAAAAQRETTCPWNFGNSVETASTVSSRQPSSRSTCPWGGNANEVQQPTLKKMVGKIPESKCPWGADVNDRDSVKLADAARRRQLPSPKNYGAAGSGAPKGGPAAQTFAPVKDEFAEVTQKLDVVRPDVALASGDDEDKEQREIIQQCLAEGLSEDSINEILDQWQNNKLLQLTQKRLQMEQPQSFAAPKLANDPQCRTSGNSLAANRQAKAKKSLSLGPSDEEIVDVLNDYSKENQTPIDSGSNTPTLLTLAAKRAKDREASEAAFGSFDSEKSRAAYFHSKSQADAVKNKNRLGSGIF